MMPSGRVQHYRPCKLAKTLPEVKTYTEKCPRGIFKEGRDVGRGCNFGDPPMP